MRISDILAFREKDIAQVMYVHETKTKKFKIVKYSDELYSRLSRLGSESDSHAFKSLRKPETHICRSAYHRRLKNASKALKIDFSAHSTRKLYAQNVFDLRNDIFDVQKALNHEYITTTAGYLDIDIVQLINSELMNRRNTIPE